MKLPRWVVRRVEGVVKSIVDRILVPSYEAGRTAQNQHLEEDWLATNRIYGEIPTAYAGIQAIANAVSMVPMTVVNAKGQEQPRHELKQLLDHVNDDDTPVDLLEQTMIFLECTGTMPWLLEGGTARVGGQPTSIVPLNPNRVRPVLSRKTRVSGYAYSVNDEVIEFNRKEILYFRYFDPADPKGIGGMGSVRAMIGPATVDMLAARFNKGFFARGAVLSGVIETDSEDIEFETMKRYVDEFREAHQGSERAWDVRGLSHGLKWKPTQPTHTDMLFEKLRGMNREEMLMSIGVPPVMVTLLDGATYANANQQEYAFWIATVLPKLRKLEARINKDLARRYGEDVFVLFDVSGIRALQPDRTAHASVITQMTEHRVLNPNEGRIYLSSGRMPRLDPYPGGDEFLTSLQVQTLDEAQQAREAQSSTPPADNAPADMPMDNADGGDQVENLLDQMVAVAKAIDLDRRRKTIEEETGQVRQASEVVFERAAREVFAEQLRAVTGFIELSPNIRSMTEAKNINELNNVLGNLEEKHRQRFIGVYTQSVGEAGKLAMDLLGLGIDYRSSSMAAVVFSNTEGAALVTRINATTMDELRGSLTEGLASGDTVQELTERVRMVLGEDASAFRARNIAQSESNKALNFGHLDAWKQTDGIVKRKGWLSSGDEKTRDSHAQADGQEVGIDDFFEVGGALMSYPGDTSHGAPVEEIAGCRCNMIPIVGDSDKARQNGHRKVEAVR